MNMLGKSIIITYHNIGIEKIYLKSNNSYARIFPIIPFLVKFESSGSNFILNIFDIIFGLSHGFKWRWPRILCNSDQLGLCENVMNKYGKSTLLQMVIPS